MKTTLKLTLSALAISLSATSALAVTEILHPDVLLLDSQGHPVIESGMAMSAVETCADCHDGDFITANHDHPLHIASNCLLCHSDDYNAEAYFDIRNSDAPSWAALSGLANQSFATATAEGWTWSDDLVASYGEVSAAELNLTTTKSSVCGSCHGIVHNDFEPLVIDPNQPLGRLTRSEGAIYSGQRVSDSGLNVANKSEQHRSFDIHAERLLECTDCHRAANNPVHGGAHGSNLSHLTYDPRQADLSDFLERPDHNLVIGAAGNEGECKGCHAPEENHSWLEEVEQHFEALTCQACHITEMYGPAQQLVDDSVRDINGNGISLARSLNGNMGFQPLLLQRPEDGKFAPYNVTMTRFWRDALSNETVPSDLIDQAWQNAAMAPANIDSTLSDRDVQALTEALVQLGVGQPEIATIIKPIAINHGVSRDSFALDDCAACHSEDGRLQSSLPLVKVDSDFDAPASLANGAMPAMVLEIDANNQLLVKSASEDDYRLSSTNPIYLMGGGLFGILGALLGWQWFKRSRR